MKRTPVPCVVCGRSLDNINEDGNQPSGGLEFASAGHYGTTEFDPMDGSSIAVNICDPCLRLKTEVGAVLHYGPKPVVRRPRPVVRGLDAGDVFPEFTP